MNWLTLFQYAVCLIVPLVIVAMADRYFPVLRDIPVDTLVETTKRPYSLGRVQMAFWTVIVVGSMVFIYWVGGNGTGTFPALDADLVILLGISGGTGLLAAAVDINKDKEVEKVEANFAGTGEAIRSLDAQILALASVRGPTGQRTIASGAVNNLVAERAVKMGELAQQQRSFQRSKRDDVQCGLIKDLLMDPNGNSLHRLQLVLFTVLFGAYVISRVYQASATDLPKALSELFSTEQLALMGVASGVYLGFKVPGKSAV
jgi:hypothetical protein